MHWRGLFARLKKPPVRPEPPGYRVYTHAFDREIRLDELDGVLGPMLPHHAREHEALKTEYRDGLGAWRASANMKAVLFRNEFSTLASPELRARTAITILLDLSGSMRGQRILMSLAVVETVGTMLNAMGFEVEILGYTTATWKGGRSRLQWLRSGKRAWPGRLNDLLHIAIAAGGGRDSVRLTDFARLLRPDLLKENIDGEAVIWAADRLRRRAASRRILIVVSDGAPVDDSTLSVNGERILADHLAGVVGEIEKDGSIDLAGIGIDYDISRFYRLGHSVSTADEMLEANFSIFRSMFALEPQPTFWDLEAE